MSMSFLDACKEIGTFLLAVLLAPFVLGMWVFGDWWDRRLKDLRNRKKKHRALTALVLFLTAPLFVFWPLAWLGTKFVEDF